MPKTLVLTSGRTGNTAAHAAGVADGVLQVRFAEVDVRHVEDIDVAEAASAYDALVVEVDSAAGVMAEGTRRALEALARAAAPHAFTHKVGAVFGAGDGIDSAGLWAAMAALGDLGMVLVPPTRAQDADAARQLGKRVAEVTGWVTHARSHHHHH